MADINWRQRPVVNGIQRPRKADWRPGWWQADVPKPTAIVHSEIYHCGHCRANAERKAAIAARPGHGGRPYRRPRR